MGQAFARNKFARAALALALLSSAPMAHALFGDDEARKAILDLRGRFQQHQDETTARLAAVEAQLAEALARLDQSGRGQLEAQSQFEQLRLEVARLRGQVEVQANELAVMQRQLHDQLATVDNRIKRFEPVTVEIDGSSATV